MTYTNSYLDTVGPSATRDSSSATACPGSRSHYRYFWDTRRGASSSRVNLTLATDDGTTYIDWWTTLTTEKGTR